jgi:seryl-tRNA synthetase
VPKTDFDDLEKKLTVSLTNFQKNEIVTEKIEQSEISFNNIFSDSYQEPVFEKIDDLKNEIENIEAEIENIEAEIEFMEAKISETGTYVVKIEEDSEKFEETVLTEIIEPKSIVNDKPVGVFNISLNDRIGFVQRLFDNNNEDYNRVLSQLSTIDTFAEAKDFISNMVKPDYDNWDGNEDFEERFMTIVAEKFNN